MANRQSLCCLLLAFVSVLPSYCQTPLAQSFAAMKSKDPKIVDEAMRNAVAVFSEEMPTIEKDTQLLCSSLHDADASIRRQAAAMLASIDFTGPGHSKVIVACFPDLLAAAGDPDKTTHTAVLYALALTPNGPLSTAHNVFVGDLNSPDDRTALLAAVGLIKTGGERKQDNERGERGQVLPLRSGIHPRPLCCPWYAQLLVRVGSKAGPSAARPFRVASVEMTRGGANSLCQCGG